MEIKEEDVRFNLPTELGRCTAVKARMTPSLQIGEALLDSARETMRRGASYLLSRQTLQGFWWADLTADTTLESDFILLELWRHPPENGVWNPPTRGR